MQLFYCIGKMVIVLKLGSPKLAPVPSLGSLSQAMKEGEMHPSFMAWFMVVGAKRGDYVFVLFVINTLLAFI
ncbi:hypothetical protein JOC86_003065 [Bacillus pakistanensis]|uniref:Uncharacterized protein n=1 Tax=Rossellomorea pakistanensis TaxID=992288 RepID=A0ABS2NF76_9BACI|nr:hypothetical protein [Bacillus pakistanensis]